MADILKELSSYSAETLNVAINSVLKEDSKRKQFEENLKAIAAVLESPSSSKKKKVEKRHTIPSDKTVFEEFIVPQVREFADKYDEYEKRAQDPQWNLDLSFVDKIANGEFSDMMTIKSIHAEILIQEQVATSIQLTIAYHRGLLYLLARQFVGKDTDIKKWFISKFNVAYATIHRYQSFAMLIQAYPRLLVSSLSFAQITKHHNRILDYLSANKDLADKLRAHVTITVQNKGVDIESADVEGVPKLKIPLLANPDFVYETDDWYNPSLLVDDNVKKEEEQHSNDCSAAECKEDDDDVLELVEAYERELSLE